MTKVILYIIIVIYLSNFLYVKFSLKCFVGLSMKIYLQK